MLKLATVVFPFFGAFDLVLLRRTPALPPRTIDTQGIALASEPPPPSNVRQLRPRAA